MKYLWRKIITNSNIINSCRVLFRWPYNWCALWQFEGQYYLIAGIQSHYKMVQRKPIWRNISLIMGKRVNYQNAYQISSSEAYSKCLLYLKVMCYNGARLSTDILLFGRASINLNTAWRIVIYYYPNMACAFYNAHCEMIVTTITPTVVTTTTTIVKS